MPGAPSAASRARPAAGRAWRGLAWVLAGPDPAPARQWRSPWQRRAAHGALGVATLVACAASVISLPGVAAEIFSPRSVQSVAVSGLNPPSWLMPGGPMPMALLVLVALAVVAPLPLAARYPLLGWRIAPLALLVVPLGGIYWWRGWAWDPVQLPMLVAVYCVAGVRHQRPVLWWMWALSLIPWWLQVGKDRLGLLACALGSAGLTAAAVAVDSGGSRRRAQQALAGQAEATELERARRAGGEERARTAGELRDGVAQHLAP